MNRIDIVLPWIQTFGIGGAFFLIALGSIGICGLALWVVLAVLRRAPP